MEGIGDVAPLRDFAEGGVGVGIRDGSVALVEFHHVFGQVPAVDKPAARRLDSERACGDGFRRVPQDVPQGRVRRAFLVEGCDLQVVPVVERSCLVTTPFCVMRFMYLRPR